MRTAQRTGGCPDEAAAPGQTGPVFVPAPLPGNSPTPADGPRKGCQDVPGGGHAGALRGRADLSGMPALHSTVGSVAAPVTSQAVVVAVRELAGSAASGAEIARQTGLPENRICETRTILRLAPDLADVVAAGRMGLTRAYRAAVARHAGPIDLATVTNVTVAQMARLLHVCPDTVYRAIRSGDLETDPTRHPIRIPADAARAYLAGHGATSGQQEDLLRPAAAATAHGLSTGSLARSADSGQLPAIRTPGGHRRYPTSPQAIATGRPATDSLVPIQPIP